MQRRASLALVLAACTAPARAAAPALLRDLRVRVGQSLQERVATARDGDVVELDAGVHRGQTAVITQPRLTLRGRDGLAVLRADGAHAEGKALLVVRGGDVALHGLELRGCRVPAGNGAGIRFERGRLTLRDCHFFDNEMGLLSANVADAGLDIEACRFGQAPAHEGLLHHLLYVGRMAQLRLAGCWLGGGWRGHLVKSRAAVNDIVANVLDDGPDGQASYELDLPDGGLARVVGNVLVQGRQPQNPALLAYGAEGRPHENNALRVAHNSFVSLTAEPAAFVRVWPERLPPGTPVHLRNNLMVGAAVAGTMGDAVDGNQHRPLDDLDQALLPRVALHSQALPLHDVAPADPARGRTLTPDAQPRLPWGLQPLPPLDRWRPGAFQD